MFKIDFFVDDKNVARVMHALNGVALELSVVPVANAKSRGGKVKAVTSGDSIEMFLAWIDKHDIAKITPSVIQDFMESLGRQRTSYSAFLGKAIKAGVVKKARGTTGKSTVYLIEKPNAKKG